ncbi:MAG TPA: hypothetical protein VN366_11670 [Feifaniaceae bacterium]|nr:hypothetical protein [Feifaniaceae bacterium]
MTASANFALLTLPYGEGELHPVVFADEETLVLTDCGYPGALPLLEAGLKAHGFEPPRLDFAQDRAKAEASLKFLLHGCAHVRRIACYHGGLYRRPE